MTMKRTVRTTQPQHAVGIDWGNPITRGLVFAFNAADGVIRKPNSNASVSVPKVIAKNGIGTYSASPAGTTPIFQTGQTGVTGADYSLFAFAYPNALAAICSVIDDDVDTSSPRCFQFRLNSGKVELITFDTSGNPYFATAPSALTSNEAVMGVAMAAVVKGNSIASFQNGKKTSGTASNTQRTPTGDFYIGQHKGTGATGWQGALHLCAIFNRALSDAEIKSLSDNPWQIFSPVRTPIFVPLGAVGSTANGTTVSHTNAIIAGAATGKALVSGATLSHGVSIIAGSASAGATANGVTVTQANALIAGSATGKALINGITLAHSVALMAGSASAGTVANGATVTHSNALVAGSATGKALVAGATVAHDVIFIAGSASGVTATIARPGADTSAGTWLPSSGTDLWAMLDEVTPEPADYIYTNTMGSDAVLSLTSTVYPGGAAQTLKFVASSTTGNSLIIELFNTGGATIKTITQALTSVDTQYDIPLSGAEIAAITSGLVSVRLRGV